MKLFHISCFITDTYLHDAMLMLEKYHVRNLEVKTIRTTETNGTGKKKLIRGPGAFNKTGAEEIANLVSKTPLRWSELRNAFTATGRSPKSITSALALAMQLKLVKRNSSGQYTKGSKA